MGAQPVTRRGPGEEGAPGPLGARRLRAGTGAELTPNRAPGAAAPRCARLLPAQVGSAPLHDSLCDSFVATRGYRERAAVASGVATRELPEGGRTRRLYARCPRSYFSLEAKIGGLDGVCAMENISRTFRRAPQTGRLAFRGCSLPLSRGIKTKLANIWWNCAGNGSVAQSPLPDGDKQVPLLPQYQFLVSQFCIVFPVFCVCSYLARIQHFTKKKKMCCQLTLQSIPS